MLVKQLFGVHQIIPHVARKKVISSRTQEIDSLIFWCQQSRRKLFLGKPRFYNKYVNYANKYSGPICFFTWNVERLPPSSFWFMFQYNWLELYYLFPQLHSAKTCYLDQFTLSLLDDCSDCHRHWVLHSFYLWLVSSLFFHSLFSHSQYIYQYSIPLLHNVPNYTPRW